MQKEKVVAKEYAIIKNKFIWLGRLTAVAGNDNLDNALSRLNELLPEWNVPSIEFFSTAIDEYLNDPIAFREEQKNDPCGDFPLFQQNEERIENFRDYLEAHEYNKVPERYTEEYSVLLRQLVNG